MSFLTGFKNLFAQDTNDITCSAESILNRINAGEQLTLIDVREASELRGTGIIPNAIHIPLGQLDSKISTFSAQKEIICYCRSGNRSKTAANIFQKQNLNAISMNGGIMLWQRLSGPTEPWK